MDLSIIIVNWNTRDLLDRCLRAVFSTVRRPAEVIVVDNGSSDGSAELVAERHPRCILIRNRSNRGFSEANNQGLRIAKGVHVLLLNSDAAPLEGCVDGMVEFLEKHPSHGAACGQLLYEDGRLQGSYRRFPTLLALLAANTSLRYHGPGKRQLDRWYRTDIFTSAPRDVDQPAAACMMLRREVIERVGLFDRGCHLLYNDVDLCRRIRAAGYRIAFLPHLRTIHTGCASLERYDRLDDEALRNVLHYVRKHYGPLLSWAFALAAVTDRLRLGRPLPRER